MGTCNNIPAVQIIAQLMNAVRSTLLRYSLPEIFSVPFFKNAYPGNFYVAKLDPLTDVSNV